jgi:hypothetical protein
LTFSIGEQIEKTRKRLHRKTEQNAILPPLETRGQDDDDDDDDPARIPTKPKNRSYAIDDSEDELNISPSRRNPSKAPKLSAEELAEMDIDPDADVDSGTRFTEDQHIARALANRQIGTRDEGDADPTISPDLFNTPNKVGRVKVVKSSSDSLLSLT